MSSEVVISVQNVTKAYKLYNSPLDRLKEAVDPFGRCYHHEFSALKNISFEIKKGESVGIIGKNGSGKSTLLKLITGIISPTNGKVLVKGKISALLELGTGFNPELTGIENIYFNGMLMGYSREEIDYKLDEILAFADIGEFVKQPIKSYSSGMFVRLAFAVATNINPDILIIDEALSVGDIFFQQKCFSKMKKILESGVTVLFVSHDMNALQNICNRAILLRKGLKVVDSNPIECVSAYYLPDEIGDEYKMRDSDTVGSGSRLATTISRIDVKVNSVACSSSNQQGDKLLEISAVEFINCTGLEFDVEEGDYIVIRVLIKANQFIVKPNVGFSLFDRMNNLLFCTSAYQMNYVISPMKPRDEEIVTFKIKMEVRSGQYTFAIGCSSMDPSNQSIAHVHHRWLDLGPINVVTSKHGRPSINGMVHLPSEVGDAIISEEVIGKKMEISCNKY